MEEFNNLKGADDILVEGDNMLVEEGFDTSVDKATSRVEGADGLRNGADSFVMLIGGL